MNLKYKEFDDPKIIADDFPVDSLKKISVENITIGDSTAEYFPDFMFILDYNGKILNYYQKYEFSYFNQNERNIRDVFSPDAAGKIISFLPEMRKNKLICSFEYSLPVNSINRVYQIQIIPSSDDTAILSGKEITKTKRAEEALKQSELRFRSVWENSIDGMRLVDMNGNIVSANKAYSHLVGLRSDEYLGRPFTCVYSDKNDTQKHITEFKKNFSERRIKRFLEIEADFRSGKCLIVEVSNIFIESSQEGNLEGEVLLLSIFRDITERKKAENELKESEEKYRTLIDTSPDPIFLMSTRGDIIIVNKQFCRTFQVINSVIAGQSIFNYLASSEVVRLKKDIENILITRKPLKNEYVFKKINEEKFPAEINTSLIYEHSQEQIAILAIVHDISERKKAEEELRKSEKLAAIGRMATYLSHEIKTPLASIRMNIDLISRDPELAKGKEKSLNIIQKEIRRLNKLLRNVLQYSKNYELLIVSIDAGNLINNIIELIDAQLEVKRIRFYNNIKDLRINGDYQKLQSVFLHLIENSIEAIGSDGIIEAYAEKDEENDTATIFIKDNGCGIQNTENIFEPFHTTKNTGTGLGLSIAQRIIEQHNGHLKLYSSNPGNTVFGITLNNYGI